MENPNVLKKSLIEILDEKDRQLTALYSRNISLKAMKSVNVSSMSKMSPGTSSLCCLQMEERHTVTESHHISKVLSCHLVASCNIIFVRHNRCIKQTTVWAEWLLSMTRLMSPDEWSCCKRENSQNKMASGESRDVTSYMSSSMKVFMLKPGILSISCCSRCFSSRST